MKPNNLWMRIGVCENIRKGDLPFKDAKKKWSAPRRRLSQWLKAYDAGQYSNLPSLYTQEELKKMFRLKAGGNNDCGCCVNELARCFAQDPQYFLEGNVDVNFNSLLLQCGQAATLLKWLFYDVCE